jgi:hypothetical protein
MNMKILVANRYKVVLLCCYTDEDKSYYCHSSSCEVSGSPGNKYEDCSTLRYSAV